MKITETERAILLLLNKTLAALSTDSHDKAHHLRAAEMLERGYHTLHSDDCLPLMYEPMSRVDMIFVGEIMTLYQRLQWSAEKVGMDPAEVIFPGFDGNHETAMMGYARYMMEKMDRFRGLKVVPGHNSHCPMIDRYAGMLATAPVSRELSAEQIRAILDAPEKAQDRRGRVITL